MAQYKHNFYGTSYYGATNAYSGIYETDHIDTDERLNGVVDFKIKAKLPKALYKNEAEEIEIEPRAAKWTKVAGTIYGQPVDYKVINNRVAKITIRATCDFFQVHFLGGNDSADAMTVQVKTWDTDTTHTTQSFTFSAKKATTTPDTWKIDQLAYGTHEFTISFPAEGTGSFVFGGFEIGATHLTVETRAGLDGAAWSDYVPVTYTKKALGGDLYLLEGTTISYADKNRLQLKIFMATSDNDLSPEIEEILTTAGDTKNRTEDGRWIANIDMAKLATAAGKTFAKILSFNWTDTKPAGTNIIYRSKTAATEEGLATAPTSVPYVKNTKRLRLKDGKNYGYVTTGLLNPSARNANLQNLFWSHWADSAHLPQDMVETGYRYEFLDEKNQVIHTIQNPSTESFKLLEPFIKNRPFKLRIQLFKRFDKESPAVDHIIFTSKLHFTQDKVFNNQDVSAIDAKGTGEKQLLDMATLTYNLPGELTKNDLEYKLIDETVRPANVAHQDLYLYFKSEKELTNRTNITSLPNDLVWVKTNGKEPGSTSGPILHYQYGGGTSYFETEKDNIKKYNMSSAFTPSLVSDKKYRAFLKSGWPTNNHVVKKGETLHSISLYYGFPEEEIKALPSNAHLKSESTYNADGTIKENYMVEIPNQTINENVDVYWSSEKTAKTDTRTFVSDKLSHNGTTSDEVMAEVFEAHARGEVDWTSEEKIYDGFLNLNDVKQLYLREHVIPNEAKDQEHAHTVKVGETYGSIASFYGINEEDIRWKNQARDKQATDSPITGSVLIIPSRIILPTVPPGVKVGNTPYEIEIIHNSIKSKNEALPREVIDQVELEVIYKETDVVRQAVLRGPNPNTSDLLPSGKVLRVNGIYQTLVENVSAPYYLAGVDYNVVGNHVDWSLTNAIGKEPAPGTTYYVSYTYNKPVAVKVKIGSDYQVQMGSDRLWRSAEIKEFSGTVTPEEDFRAKLPPIESWKDYNTKDVYNIDYVIEDNDLWTKTWIEEQDGESFIVGSLMGKKPKDNWLPYIHTGFYYLGKEETYLFSEEKRASLGRNDIPIAKNVRYVDGQYGMAVGIEPGSSNLVRNSTFDQLKKQTVIRKVTF